ncbi:MAG: PASTA domain-containing protein [Microbacteriaceae bacterium]
MTLLIAGGAVWGIVEAQKVEVPDLAGLSITDGASQGIESGLLPESDGVLPSTDLSAFTSITRQTPAAGTRVFRGTPIVYKFELVEVKVPSAEGRTVSEATKLFASQGLLAEPFSAQLLIDHMNYPSVTHDADENSIKAVAAELGLSDEIDLTGDVFEINSSIRTDHWIVLDSSPAEFEAVVAGSEVRLTVALPITQVPNVLGKSVQEATYEIRNHGLTPSSISEPTYSGKLPSDFQLDAAYLEQSYWGIDESAALSTRVGSRDEWKVSAQTLSAGAVVRVGDVIDLGVKWPTGKMPSLKGKNVDEVHEMLLSAGFSTSAISSNSTGIVISQKPKPGTSLPLGVQVTAEIRHKLTYSVSSSAGRGSVTWIGPGTFSIQQANGASLPWSKSWYPQFSPDAYDQGNFNAQMNAGGGWITCAITLDGRVIEKNTSTGPYAVVSCG